MHGLTARVSFFGAIDNALAMLDFFGATRRIRTDDLLITNQLLYQLS
jgi:hypothetical protein